MRLAFLGDSVTEGCFELYYNQAGEVDCIRDYEHCYAAVLTDMLKSAYPELTIDTKNFGVSGHSSNEGVTRIGEVLAWQPDIVIICYGLNDICHRSKEAYTDNLKKVFESVTQSNVKGVFMTPNMINTYVHEKTLARYIGMAHNTCEYQNNGTFDEYIDSAKETAKSCGLTVCDVYEYWKSLRRYGIDTTLLLSNFINHPTRKMHLLFAEKLFEILKTLL